MNECFFHNTTTNVTQTARIHAVIECLKFQPDTAYEAFRKCVSDIGRSDLLVTCLPQMSDDALLPTQLKAEATTDSTGTASSLPRTGIPIVVI